MVKVILSTALLIGEGDFSVKKVSKKVAQKRLDSSVVNYCGHDTVKILDLEPAMTRENCEYYDEALAIKAKQRLERREYSQEEIEKIGVEFILIKRK